MPRTEVRGMLNGMCTQMGTDVTIISVLSVFKSMS